MAIIVEHKKTGGRYFLVGAGFGAYKSSKPNWFFGDWASDDDSGEYAMVAVCNSQGRIGWLYSRDIEVVEVDGRSPSELAATT